MPPFPKARPVPQLPEALQARGLSLRVAGKGDLPFLRTLFGSFRALELLMVPWPPEQKQAFLDDQFRLQHTHFTRFHPACGFWLVEQQRPLAAPAPVGRLYLDRSQPRWCIVDIGFMPETRGQGLGAGLIEWIKAEAAVAGVEGVALSVAANNPGARALYQRLGFTDDGPAEHMHQPMFWRC
jgi:ribosomal protein S18 acetylase RimI-like enzyme